MPNITDREYGYFKREIKKLRKDKKEMLESMESAVKFISSGTKPYDLLWDCIHRINKTKPY